MKVSMDLKDDSLVNINMKIKFEYDINADAPGD